MKVIGFTMICQCVCVFFSSENIVLVVNLVQKFLEIINRIVTEYRLYIVREIKNDDCLFIYFLLYHKNRENLVKMTVHLHKNILKFNYVLFVLLNYETFL